MVNNIWSVLCVRHLIDNDTNSLSLIDVVEGIDVSLDVAEKKKLKHGITSPTKMTICSYFILSNQNSPFEMPLRIEQKDPDGKTLYSNELVVPFGGNPKMRYNIKIGRFKINQQKGPYVFALSIRATSKSKTWKQVSSIPFSVNDIWREKSATNKVSERSKSKKA